MCYLGCDLGDVRDIPLPFLHVEHRSDTAYDSDVPLDLEQLVVNASAQLILLHTQERRERRGEEERGKEERGEEREKEERKRDGKRGEEERGKGEREEVRKGEEMDDV